ncbi:ABC transporter permease [Nitratireductor kimnyeongensis]|uniref:ABC transporter permease n=1 Tax=Nitratireductor kimnyeongensis TaxID=430679 RepID=A0ABW0TD99_9HYPH|nr:ABC transporter permease [Nitratireductor kimnyeongensis]QZZ36953.1 ABC transporter permease [Nitratireductor kimnyeongensis]
MTRLLIHLRRYSVYRGLTDLYARSPLARVLIVSIVPLLWILGTTAAPLTQMVLVSFHESFPVREGETVHWTLANYASFLERPLYLTAFVRSFVFATVVTFLTLLVVFPIAYYIAKVAPRSRRTRLLLLVVAPFWVSEIIRSFAWIVMLANRGAVNSFLSFIGMPGTPVELLYNNVSLTIGIIYLTSLYMLLPLYAALEKIDDNVLEAAANLGAPGWQRFLRIVLPLSRDGVVAGCSLVFLLVIGLYAMPQLLGGPGNTLFATTIGQIFAKAGASWPQGSAFSIILTGTALAYVGLFVAIFQRRGRGRA